MKKSISRIMTIVENLPESDSSYEYEVQRDVQFTLVLVGVGLVKAQAKIIVRLAGKGASATIIGIILGDKAAEITLHTMQVHAAPDTTSDLLVKTVLRGSAKCMYDGGIRVEKAAQKTNAYQRNENLLLSDTTYAESKPSLEILANDVRCTHGATVGPIDAEQLWYLSTRGIARSKGEELIADGFINSALMRIADTSVRDALQKRFTHTV